MKRTEYLAEFEKTLKQMLATTKAKNQDYADGEDAFQNFRNVEQMGLCSVETGILTRMTDKLQRLANLSKRGASVKSESLADTALDLAVYSIILKVYLENR